MKTPTKKLPTYPGPSLDEVQAYSDEKVAQEFIRLDITPRPLHGLDGTDEWLILVHGLEDNEHVWTPKEIAALRQQTEAKNRVCLRTQLFSEYLMEWIGTLSDSVCWSIVEAGEEIKVPISERRYTPRDKLHSRTSGTVYAQLVTAITTPTTRDTHARATKQARPAGDTQAAAEQATPKRKHSGAAVQLPK